jgi:hypothetical protein
LFFLYFYVFPVPLFFNPSLQIGPEADEGTRWVHGDGITTEYGVSLEVYISPLMYPEMLK